jgi:hypothetical protein
VFRFSGKPCCEVCARCAWVLSTCETVSAETEQETTDEQADEQADAGQIDEQAVDFRPRYPPCVCGHCVLEPFPGEVDNRTLRVYGKKPLTLIRTLIPQKDYLVLPVRAFNQLISHYGGGPTLGSYTPITTSNTLQVEVFKKRVLVFSQDLPLGQPKKLCVLEVSLVDTLNTLVDAIRTRLGPSTSSKKLELYRFEDKEVGVASSSPLNHHTHSSTASLTCFPSVCVCVCMCACVHVCVYVDACGCCAYVDAGGCARIYISMCVCVCVCVCVCMQHMCAHAVCMLV